MDVWRVNLRERSLKREPVPETWERLGGRGLSARILLDEVPATCEPLGPAQQAGAGARPDRGPHAVELRPAVVRRPRAPDPRRQRGERGRLHRASNDQSGDEGVDSRGPVRHGRRRTVGLVGAPSQPGGRAIRAGGRRGRPGRSTRRRRGFSSGTATRWPSR